MQVALKDGRVLLLDDNVRFSKGGYFVLDSRPCGDPDLGMTPAIYVDCEDLQTIYTLHQWEFVLGKAEDVE